MDRSLFVSQLLLRHLVCLKLYEAIFDPICDCLLISARRRLIHGPYRFHLLLHKLGVFPDLEVWDLLVSIFLH